MNVGPAEIGAHVEGFISRGGFILAEDLCQSGVEICFVVLDIGVQLILILDKSLSELDAVFSSES